MTDKQMVKQRAEKLQQLIDKMWGNRYDADIDHVELNEDSDIICAVTVDLGDLAMAKNAARNLVKDIKNQE